MRYYNACCGVGVCAENCFACAVYRHVVGVSLFAPAAVLKMRATVRGHHALFHLIFCFMWVEDFVLSVSSQGRAWSENSSLLFDADRYELPQSNQTVIRSLRSCLQKCGGKLILILKQHVCPIALQTAPVNDPDHWQIVTEMSAVDALRPFYKTVKPTTTKHSRVLNPRG